MENDEKNVLKGVSDGCGKTEKIFANYPRKKQKTANLWVSPMAASLDFVGLSLKIIAKISANG
ncbi:MAG TPA: hypothetical protein P5080_04615 [Candidatus Paceibacterota bacterium]|nr:hypothetical protein [Candidatus Paceibacterota bacterium]HSA36955.1 hypothetical protein [Candidatus Paceibacterota bacterium]